MTSLYINSYDDDPASGYGRANKEFHDQLYFDFDFWDASPNVLNLCMPKDYIIREKSIGFTPWESTEIPEDWIEPLSKVDEFWTMASWTKEIFGRYTKSEPWIMPMGLDRKWSPIQHYWPEHRPFTFLHVGEPAIRKGGDLVWKAYRKRYADDPNYRLIFKCRGVPISAISSNTDMSPYDSPSVVILGQTMHPAELWKTYALSDCLVYPTRGEGFGLIPFEAMGCALPTIVTNDHMGDFVNLAPINLYNTKRVKSDNQYIHPGDWLDHDIDEIIHAMEMMVDNYNDYADEAYAAAEQLHKQYNWENLAVMASERIQKVLS